mmetsp:Transcript_28252/g.67084  ORF Transcript_28252/g.67084 Transcript_28252/m.67084 type:complete len:231 (+) Transcript_28252:331-1023(+)
MKWSRSPDRVKMALGVTFAPVSPSCSMALARRKVVSVAKDESAAPPVAAVASASSARCWMRNVWLARPAPAALAVAAKVRRSFRMCSDSSLVLASGREYGTSRMMVLARCIPTSLMSATDEGSASRTITLSPRAPFRERSLAICRSTSSRLIVSPSTTMTTGRLHAPAWWCCLATAACRSMWMASSFQPMTTVWSFSSTAKLDPFTSSIQLRTSAVMKPWKRPKVKRPNM